MKNLIKYTLIFLFFMVTTIVGAQNSEYAVSKYSLTEIASGQHANETNVNKTGMTGQQVYDLMDAYTMEFAQVHLPEFMEQSIEVPISEKHYNTQAFTDRLEAYFDRTPSGNKRVLRGAEIKVDCCNFVGTDPGVINNFLKKYFSQKISQPSAPKTIGDGNSLTEKEKTIDTMNVNIKLEGLDKVVAQQTNYNFPWGPVLITALILILFGVIIWLVSKSSAKSARKDDKKAIKGFLKMHRKANEDSAENFVTVGRTLRSFNTPPGQ